MVIRAAVFSPTVDQTVPLPEMVALVQRGAAGGARETRHMVDQIPSSHHQLRGGNSGTASRTSRHGEQPEDRIHQEFHWLTLYTVQYSSL